MSDQIEQPQSMSIDEAAAQLNAQMQQQQEPEDTPNDPSPAIEPEEPAEVIDPGEEPEEPEIQPEEPSPEEVPSIETLSELAEALGQPLEHVEDNLTATVTVNGEQKQVSLKDLKAGYQLEQASRQNMQRAAEMKRQFEAEKQQHVAEIEKQHQILAGVMNEVRNIVVGPINTAELERLRVENPGEYAVVRLQIEDRMRQFDQLLHQGSTAYQEMDDKRRQEQRASLDAYLQGEREKLMEAVPDWSDEESRKVFGFLQGLGYTPEQLNSVYDHRHLVMARESMLYRQQQEKAKTATAKVRQLPKLAKPGPKNAGVRVESAAIEKARRRFAQTKSLEDASALMALQLK